MTTSDALVPQVGTELVNPATGTRTVFRATGASTGGDHVLLEQHYPPASTPPPTHLHPAQDERFTVVHGHLVAVVGDDEHELRDGDELDVPRGTPHRMWAPSDAPTLVLWRTSPALRTDLMHAELWQVAADADGHPDPMALLEVLLRYPEEFRLC